MKLPEFKVAILCMTYQHALFIKDALDGFCMQETSFPFIAAVVDDASTDGEQEVINRYLKDNFVLNGMDSYYVDAEEGYYTCAQHKTNRNCYILSLNLKKNLYKKKGAKSKLIARWTSGAKYIAECEGDDYWTDPLKLQKQVDFLEGHDEYVMCSHNYIRYFEKTMAFEEHSWYDDCFKDGKSCFVSYSLNEYFKRWWTQPLTCMYRNGEYLRFIPRPKYRNYRDDIFFYYVLKEGKGALFGEVMGVYRIHDGGVWQGKDFIKKHKSGRDNALAIYMNENDKRALCRASRDEMAIIVDGLWDGCCRWEALKEIMSYRKKVPVSEYCRFLGSIREWFSGKIKRKTRAMFKVNKSYV